MGKIAALLALLATPAAAWEFTPVPICTLWETTPQGEIRITFDPSTGLYEFRATFAEDKAHLRWSDSSAFSITFYGDQQFTIATDQHVVSEDRRTLSVVDKGFGNVLNGLEFNSVAEAATNESRFGFPLHLADKPVQAFRACGESALS